MSRSGAVRGDRGSGSALTAVLVLVLVGVGSVAMGVVQAHLVAGRTQSAADLAALAAAGSGGCADAAATARANGAELLECASDGPDVIVSVQNPAPTLLSRVAFLVGGGTDRVIASARAGYPSS